MRLVVAGQKNLEKKNNVTQFLVPPEFRFFPQKTVSSETLEEKSGEHILYDQPSTKNQLHSEQQESVQFFLSFFLFCCFSGLQKLILRHKAAAQLFFMRRKLPAIPDTSYAAVEKHRWARNAIVCE